MGFIDADAHVIETAQTWNFMLEEERRFAPELLVSARNGVEFWRIEERVFPNSNLGLNVPEDARDLTDVNSRLAAKTPSVQFQVFLALGTPLHLLKFTRGTDSCFPLRVRNPLSSLRRVCSSLLASLFPGGIRPHSRWRGSAAALMPEM